MQLKFTLSVLLLFAFLTLGAPAFAVSFPASQPPTGPDSTALKTALSEYNNLSSKEKKQRFKQVNKVIKKYKADKKAGKDVDTNTLLLVILAILLPPLAVYLHEGETNTRFWISLLLTLLALILGFSISGFFWLLAVIYALIVVLGS